MFIHALCLAFSKLDPETKYFLVRFVQRIEERCVEVTDPVQCSVKDLAKSFGITDSQVTDSLAVLLANDELGISAIPTGQGRPKRWYRLTDVYLAKLNKPAERIKSYDPPPFNKAHKEIIGRLLRHENTKPGQPGTKVQKLEGADDVLAQMRARRQPGRLSVVNRLLLGVLLCYADRFGVVRDLGSSALCKATGLNQERLKNRMARLIDMGFIKAYVPGAARSALFNKTSGVYFLNLDHPELSAGTSFTKVRAYKKKVGGSAVDLRVANQMLSDAVRFRDDPESVPGDRLRFKYIAELFQAEPQSMYPLLQFRLESYAAHLLSKYWSKIYVLKDRVGFKAHVDTELKSRIRADFSHSKVLAGMDRATAVFTGNALRDSLEDELYARARDLALSIHFVFDGKPDNPMDLMEFTIVPQTGKIGVYEVELLAISR